MTERIKPEIGNKASPINKVGEQLVIDPQVEGENVYYVWKLNGQVISTESTVTLQKDDIQSLKIELEVSNRYGTSKHNYEVEVVDVPYIEVVENESNVEYNLCTSRNDIREKHWFLDCKRIQNFGDTYISDALLDGEIQVKMKTVGGEIVVVGVIEDEDETEEVVEEVVEDDSEEETEDETEEVVEDDSDDETEEVVEDDSDDETDDETEEVVEDDSDDETEEVVEEETEDDSEDETETETV